MAEYGIKMSVKSNDTKLAAKNSHDDSQLNNHHIDQDKQIGRAHV